MPTDELEDGIPPGPTDGPEQMRSPEAEATAGAFTTEQTTELKQMMQGQLGQMDNLLARYLSSNANERQEGPVRTARERTLTPAEDPRATADPWSQALRRQSQGCDREESPSASGGNETVPSDGAQATSGTTKRWRSGVATIGTTAGA
eukprot:8737033-Pyramimonas_sp.AAC.1